MRSVTILAAMLMTCAAAPWNGHCLGDDDLGATHVEIEPIKFDVGPSGRIETMAMDAGGRLLAGVSWSAAGGGNRAAQQRPGSRRRPFDRDGGNRTYAIKVVSTAGKVIDTWPMKDVVPKMIHGCEDGGIYVAGKGTIARLNAKGEIQKTVKFGDVLDKKFVDGHASGVTANEKYFFIAFGFGFSLRATEDIVRFDRDLTSPKLIVERQYGCCSHIDLDVKGDALLIAENSRHRVNRFTFAGKPIDRWGRRDRSNIEGFAACCNPVNFDFGPNDVLYTAESGVGRVKKYSPAGKYLGMVGYVDTTKFDRGSRLAAQSCYIPIEVGKDAKRIYIMDVRAHIIRVLEQKDTKTE